MTAVPNDLFEVMSCNNPELSQDELEIALLQMKLIDAAFNPHQKRDDHGRWTEGGSSMIDKPSSFYKPMRPHGFDTKEKFSDGNGNYTPERTALHEEIMAKFLSGVTPVDAPTATILGGGMGGWQINSCEVRRHWKGKHGDGQR